MSPILERVCWSESHIFTFGSQIHISTAAELEIRETLDLEACVQTGQYDMADQWAMITGHSAHYREQRELKLLL